MRKVIQRNVYQINITLPDQCDKEFLSTSRLLSGLEPDATIYRPKIAIKQQEIKTLYQRKLEKLAIKVKQRIKSKQKQIVTDQQYIDDLLGRMVEEPETKLVLGHIFDDHITNLKQQSLGNVAKDFNKNLLLLVKKLHMKSEVELLHMHKLIIADAEKGNYVQQARSLIFQQLKREVEELRKNPQKAKWLFGKYFKGEQSTEFIFSQLEENNQEQLANLLDANVTADVAKNLAKIDIEQNIEHLRKSENRVVVKTEQDQFYESPVTNTDQSDDEKLSGMRQPSLPNGYELIDTQETIMARNTLDAVKRAYLKNKYNHLQAYEESSNQQENQYHELFIQTQLDDQDIQVEKEAHEINRSFTKPPDYKTILENIDYFLINAPPQLKRVVNDDKANKKKRFQPTFIGDENTPLESLWTEFDKNFEAIFPIKELQKEKFYDLNDKKEQQINFTDVLKERIGMISELNSIRKQINPKISNFSNTI